MYVYVCMIIIILSYIQFVKLLIIYLTLWAVKMSAILPDTSQFLYRIKENILLQSQHYNMKIIGMNKRHLY